MALDDRSHLWEQALCRNYYDDTFFTDAEEKNSRQARRAISLCKTPCPILKECFLYAMEHNELGVWGGTTGRQRSALRKRKARA